ncbi:SAUR-like auxin-responsive protein family [Perilla frutescens var. hirtella]|uniref:SAUR-like auxin-responsive protein family n=1 Tax=Perilla frutescens var. hirtella TaxID=608512 RepID=A0AAD4P085_PERFH|nr:SAUR-like auxin-responsive protein family [Perilla frutescens var. hirtella]
MAKTIATAKKRNGGLLNLKVVVKRLQRSLTPGKKSPSSGVQEITVPDDVKEGHFAVIAVDDDELKRFIVPLSFLTRPSFLRLLEQAAEYGFDHDGALTVPCRPSELERILEEQWAAERGSAVAGGGDWSCYKTMVKSC